MPAPLKLSFNTNISDENNALICKARYDLSLFMQKAPDGSIRFTHLEIKVTTAEGFNQNSLIGTLLVGQIQTWFKDNLPQAQYGGQVPENTNHIMNFYFDHCVLPEAALSAFFDAMTQSPAPRYEYVYIGNHHFHNKPVFLPKLIGPQTTALISAEQAEILKQECQEYYTKYDKSFAEMQAAHTANVAKAEAEAKLTRAFSASLQITVKKSSTAKLKRALTISKKSSVPPPVERRASDSDISSVPRSKPIPIPPRKSKSTSSLPVYGDAEWVSPTPSSSSSISDFWGYPLSPNIPEEEEREHEIEERPCMG